MINLFETGAGSSGLTPGITVPALLSDAGWDAVRSCKILIIDDEEPNVRLLERLLARSGLDNFVSTTDSSEAAALFADFQPDIVLTDWLMPKFDGHAVIEQLRALTATDEYLPIVVLTADITPQVMKRALMAGATDFLTKPFDQIEILLRIQNLLHARISHLIIQKQNATLEESVRERTIELERALTELRSSQKQVIQQERLAALGAMAGGIAHDFNNALCVIMGFGEVLLRDAERGLTRENALPSITTIITAAEDGAKIVHRLAEFYRPEQTEDLRLPVDLNDLVAQSISLTRPRWQTEATAGGRTITITATCGDIPLIAGDAAELREALTNLIFNAVDALPAGGAITIRTLAEGEAVFLKVSDTGTGMSEEVRERCLEPFFSTKGKGGTGLGLSMVFGIIQRHGGAIEIESALGQGTTFAVRLPAAGAKTVAPREALPCANRPLRILIVDDQPILSEILARCLQDDLHAVEIAVSGSDALKKFRAAEFDLVITDHVMAEMTGQKLAVMIRELNPKTPIILLTSYAGGPADENPDSEAINIVLRKPLSRVALRHALAKVMA